MPDKYPHHQVVIIQKSLRQYRLRFFELLKARLDETGIELLLIYGEPDEIEATRRDAVDLDWGVKIENANFKMGSRIVCWQPCLKYLHNADLVIVEQASKLLLNYVLFFLHLIGRRKLAFWGHGKNLKLHRASNLGEGIKMFMSRRVHWWFAYNDMSAKIVQDLGYPVERTTSVQNTIDVNQLSEMRYQVTHEQMERIRQQLDLRGDNVAIFIGAMYTDKRLNFMLEACVAIRSKVPDFEMIFIGAGPEYPRIELAARQHAWVHAVGPKFDDEKAPYSAVSKLLLLPGAVGLAVLDSFAFEVPLVTTAAPYHGPEIAYLRSGFNGVILEAATDPIEYAAVVAELLTNAMLRESLVEGCRQSRHAYSIERMVGRFAEGIERAVSRPLTIGIKTNPAHHVN